MTQPSIPFKFLNWKNKLVSTISSVGMNLRAMIKPSKRHSMRGLVRSIGSPSLKVSFNVLECVKNRFSILDKASIMANLKIHVCTTWKDTCKIKEQCTQAVAWCCLWPHYGYYWSLLACCNQRKIHQKHTRFNMILKERYRMMSKDLRWLNNKMTINKINRGQDHIPRTKGKSKCQN